MCGKCSPWTLHRDEAVHVDPVVKDDICLLKTLQTKPPIKDKKDEPLHHQWLTWQ